MHIKYVILYVLNVVVAFKIPDGTRLTKKMRKIKIKTESSKRQKPPNKLDKDTLTKMESFGFVYDETDNKWKRNNAVSYTHLRAHET